MEAEKSRCRRWYLLTTGTAAATSVVFMIFLLVLPVHSSDELQHLRLSVGRHLLQVLTDCPIDIQNLNYTVITSKCKGPKYPANICCNAFKDLACPYAPTLNDITNNCANTMFSYINLYGKYPAGLFANICRDSKRGLECTQAQMSNTSHATANNSATTAATHIIVLFLIVLYCMFP